MQFNAFLKRLLYPLLLFITVLVTFHYSEHYPSKQLQKNHRIGIAMNRGRWQAAKILKVKNLQTPDLPASTYDDGGLGMLATAYYMLSSESLGDLVEPQAVFRFARVLEFVTGLMILLMFFALAPMLGNFFAFLLPLYCLLGPHFRFVALSGDVYLFPLYSGIFMLLALPLLEQKSRKSFAALMGLCVLIMFCELTRSSSWLVSLSFFLIAFFPKLFAQSSSQLTFKKIQKRALCAFLIVFFLVVFQKQVVKNSHPFWHAIHTGLLEFDGGWVDQNKQIYPGFIPQSDIPANSRFEPTWWDQLEYDYVATIHPFATIGSKDYETVLKKDVFRIISRYPVQFASLVLKRFWRFLSLDYYSSSALDSKDGAGAVKEAKFSNLVKLFVLLMSFLSIFVFTVPRPWLAACFGLATLILPPMLVYSGNLMYNLPGHLVFLALNCFSLRRIFLLVGKKNAASRLIFGNK